MSLKKLEKAGMVAGYIPLLSTVTGIIKSIVYYNKAKSIKEPSKEINEEAQKAHNVGSATLNVNPEQKECYESLWKASIAETIPLVNFIAAIYSTTVLNKLSKLREVNDSSKNKEQFLIDKYGMLRTEFAIDDRTINALAILDLLHSTNTSFSENYQQAHKNTLAIVIAGMLDGNPRLNADEAVRRGLASLTEEELSEDTPLNEAWEIYLANQMEKEESQKELEEKRDEKLRKLRSPTKKEKDEMQKEGYKKSQDVEFD